MWVSGSDGIEDVKIYPTGRYDLPLTFQGHQRAYLSPNKKEKYFDILTV